MIYRFTNTIGLLRRITFFFAVLLTANVNAQLSPKEQAVQDFRHYFSKHAYRGHQLTKSKVEQLTAGKCIILLGPDGRFTDLVAEQERIENNKLNFIDSTKPQVEVGQFLEKAFNRIWRIAQTYRGKKYNTYANDSTLARLYKAVNNYSKIEADRGRIGAGRFHISCFAIPTAAVNTYFCLFDAMDQVEQGLIRDETAILANNNLKLMSYQSWTQPYRNDETDNNPVSVQRFQKHVWWVGGNGLGFRSLLPTAAAMSSVEMMDVLSVVSKGGLSCVSQNTYDSAFWTEGFTADGAGWGHGMQCLIWGYPISGTSAALSLVDYFKGTPWAKQLDAENAQALLNYFRGSSWYYYKGYTPRCLGRGSMSYAELQKDNIPTDKMIETVVNSWITSYSKKEHTELVDLQNDIKDQEVTMAEYPDGYYTGTRWFFNNDNLVKKNPRYYIFVSMASVRCDGIESAYEMADKYNFFTCDGMTYFMKNGNEYHQAIGGWNLTAIPGVTARQGEDKLKPVTNWRGYCSKYNFAAAATSGGANAACGFIFEKMNASNKKNVNDVTGRQDPNTIIYGVKANKAYFMVDDYTIALGAGITNLDPDMDGDIWTTIDQTHYNSEMQYFANGKQRRVKGSGALQLKGEELVWAAQKAGFAYAVLPRYTSGDVFLSAETRSAKWQELNESNKRRTDLPKTTDVFQLHINHGREVKGGRYAYIVYGGDEKAEKAFSDMPLTILENSTNLQAVKWGNGYVGASFYNAESTLKTPEGTINVSAPCALLLQEKDGNYVLTVTDAEMNKNLKSIVVKTSFPVAGNNVVNDGKWNIISVPMPQGALCGKPATVSLLKK
jgi:hypothetical protein